MYQGLKYCVSFNGTVKFLLSLEFVSEDLHFYIKLLVLLYANDTVIFGKDETSFQKNLDIF